MVAAVKAASNNQARYVVSVLVRDRVAVLRDITAAVAALDANIDAISQTVMAGYFTVILVVSAPPGCSADALHAAVFKPFAADEAFVAVSPYDPQADTRPTVEGERYIVTVSGPDKPGILRDITAFLAERGINIEDWHVTIERGVVTHVGEVTLPSRLDVKQAQDELRQVLAPHALAGSIHHENIYRATNEVGPIGSLLGSGRRA